MNSCSVRFILRNFNQYIRCFSLGSKLNNAPISMAYDLRMPVNLQNQNSALVVMHGLLGSKQNWRSICKGLSSQIGMKIFAVDARNHGDSPHTDDHSSETLAEDILEFAKMHKIENLYTMGHSMGGRAVMYLALKYPELVKGCIVVDISPFYTPSSLDNMNDVFEAMKRIQMIKADSLSEGRKMMRAELLAALSDDYKGTINFVMMNLRRRPSGEFYWACNIDALQKNLHKFSLFEETIQGLAPYHGPTLFICGRKSEYFDPKDWPKVQTLYPNAEIEWLDTYHLVHLENPVGFMNLTKRFLN